MNSNKMRLHISAAYEPHFGLGVTWLVYRDPTDPSYGVCLHVPFLSIALTYCVDILGL